jgi:phosphoribosylamine--glycine ligase
MKLLVTGNGGREHALVWKLAQSPRVTAIFVAKGNAGTAQEPKTQNIDIDATDIFGLVEFATREQIDLVVNGPEAPLALGISDAMNKAGIACIGPSQAAAQLESSKVFCKRFLAEHKIPTARFESFTDLDLALAYAKQQSYPLVIKADGLAAGKGVVIAETLEQAQETLVAFLSQDALGAAGTSVVIEEFLIGEELSYICLVNDDQIITLASAQDHKRRNELDQGPNTGGMGAYSPAPQVTPELENKILTRIIKPTLDGLRAKSTPYLGFLYAGLMITPEHEPMVLEFNCRLGDPETQAILFRLQSDLADLCVKAVEHKLDQAELHWDPSPAITVVLASAEYPEACTVGHTIEGLKPATANQKVFHAATRQEGTNLLTNGGRVLNVTAKGAELATAQKAAYELAQHIDWPGRFYRQDIGRRGLTTT